MRKLVWIALGATAMSLGGCAETGGPPATRAEANAHLAVAGTAGQARGPHRPMGRNRGAPTAPAPIARGMSTMTAGSAGPSSRIAGMAAASTAPITIIAITGTAITA